jgi:superfamily II DNA or RNA helicase
LREASIIVIPPKLCFSKAVGKNHVRQLQFPETQLPVAENPKPGATLQIHGKTIEIVSSKRTSPSAEVDHALYHVSKDGFEWTKRFEFDELKWEDVFTRREEARASLAGKFTFIEEKRDEELKVIVPGLRSPQIGAIYAALAHRRMSSEVATIVLPTGTGKTDCMAALMALTAPRCLLVVVPTDALRSQLAGKFMCLGVLVANKLLPQGVLYPTVGILKSKFDGPREIDVFFRSCNVVVTTVPLLGTFSTSHKAEIVKHCDSLFIDEAHHVKAKTWTEIRDIFSLKPTLQFTATPYRNDGQHVDGRIVFNYPVDRAQKEGYFNKIQLQELWDYVDIDESVAKAAVDQLLRDRKSGLDHIIMARASSITRADDLKKIYDEIGADFAPVVVHSKLTRSEVTRRLQKLYERKSRIAICVSMFGEGFDFPELKIAAIHDIHQSLAVTIQFAGRFTRSNPNVGNATIIVNRANDKIDESVRELYAQSGGADWNQVITKLTTEAAQTQIEKQNFYDSFVSPPLSIQNIKPKMSTVVYRTKGNNWYPFRIQGLPIVERIYGEISVSLNENTAFFVTCTNEEVEWAESADLRNSTYDLYALFWDKETRLLYINSSDNESLHEEIAKAACGDEAEIINGAAAFRVLSGIKRLLLRNMGLNDRLRRSVRFMMYTGSDVQEYLDSSSTYGKEKTHIFGDGFDGTSRVTVGTSKKGRVWSWQEAKDLRDWKRWCRGVGAKMADDSIQPDDFVQDSMIPSDITKPPDLYPLTIEWPDELYHRPEESVFIGTETSQLALFEVGVDLVDPKPAGPLKFRVSSDAFSATYELTFGEKRVTYIPEKRDLWIRRGKKQVLLSEFFSTAHPIIRYEKDHFGRGDQLLALRERKLTVFDVDKVIAWNWDGVDPKVESQTLKKLKNSIQRRAIEQIMSAGWTRKYDVVYDDDASGECADIVGMAVDTDKLVIDLFHCKHTKALTGNRIKDLYEVCGQAVRSIKWRDDIDRLILHLINREKSRKQKYNVSRFEKGDFKQLVGIRGEARTLTPQFRVFIVQPGLSKADMPADQKDLLASTEHYLAETRSIGLLVVGRE